MIKRILGDEELTEARKLLQKIIHLRNGSLLSGESPWSKGAKLRGPFQKKRRAPIDLEMRESFEMWEPLDMREPLELREPLEMREPLRDDRTPCDEETLRQKRAL